MNPKTDGWLTRVHPGGNLLVERAEGDRVWVAPDCRSMQEGTRWFCWSFRARNPEPVTIVFSHRNEIGPHGPAVSRDGGISWQWLGRKHVRLCPVGEHGAELSFTIPPVPESADIRYAFCPQYQEGDLQRWLERHAGHPELTISEFCRSRNGRVVECLRIGDTEGSSGKRKILWLMARTHACEAMASFALEGFLEAALGDDALGRALRSRAEIVATPFMDKDGVEEGDQGKLRHPHDHNRDFNKRPIYPEVVAAQAFGAAWSMEVDTFFDFHCPMVHGPWDNRFYLVGSPFSKMAAGQEAFMATFAQVRTGPVRPHGTGVLRFGEAWNTGTNFSAGVCAAIWAAQTFPNARLVASFEVPYANAEGVEINPATARQLGRDLAAAWVCFEQ